MPTIKEIRTQYPQYDDLSDSQLADALHAKFYSDMPKADFLSKIGMAETQTTPKTARVAEDRGFLRTVDDAVRGAADMLTFGLADEFAAKMGDLTGIGGTAGDYDANLAAERERDSRGGGARLAGQVAGAFMMPGAAARSVGGAAAQGAGYGAAYGFGSGEGGALERMKSAAAGGATGAAAGGVVRGVANTLERGVARKLIPSNEALSKYAEAAYKAADEAGVKIKPESTQRLASKIKADLAEFGYDTALQPGVGAVLSRIDDLANQGDISLKGMDIVRRVAGNAAQTVDNPSQKALASKIIGHIDDFVTTLKPDDVLAGDTREAVTQMSKARGAWAKLKKAQAVDVAVMKAERRAASTGSGGNADNAIRQNVRALLDNPRTVRGMTDAEKKAAERVVRGTPTQNALRLAGKLAPTGVVSGVLSGGAGYGLAGPTGLGLPLAGAGAKALADRMTVRNVEKLSELIRSGGMTVDEIVNLVRQGAIAAPDAFKAIEAVAGSVQNPMARTGAAVASGG